MRTAAGQNCGRRERRQARTAAIGNFYKKFLSPPLGPAASWACRLTRPPLLVVAVLVLPVLAEEEPSEHQTRFAEVTGAVQILAQGSKWVDAHIDLPIETGDIIQTGEDSRAEISISKNALLIVESNSEVVIGHITPQECHLTLTDGALLAKVERVPGLAQTWEFSTPYGVAQIQGTEFALTHSDEQGTHLGVFKGQVLMSPAESATGNYPPVEINMSEEGVLMKRKPVNTLKAFGPIIRTQKTKIPVLQKRFQQVESIWVPMTPTYRLELRRKYVAEVKPKPHRAKTRAHSKANL